MFWAAPGRAITSRRRGKGRAERELAALADAELALTGLGILVERREACDGDRGQLAEAGEALEQHIRAALRVLVPVTG
jgi:hypothetical protein